MYGTKIGILIKTIFKSGLNHILNCVNECDFGTKCFVKAEHFVLRLILCEGNVIRPKDIFVKQTWNPQFSTTVPNLEEVERQAIATAIRQNDGNLTATAEQLGISRQTLYNKIKRFKL